MKTVWSLLALVCLSGCNRNVESSSSSSPPAVSETKTMPVAPPSLSGRAAGPDMMPPGHPAIGPGMSAPLPKASKASEATWAIGSVFVEAPNTSPMRLATYRLKKVGADIEDGDLSISQAGGGSKANADRWVKQFDEEGQKSAKISAKTVDGKPVTFVEAVGTFAGMGGAPKKGMMLLGAIVETSSSDAYFFKLVGPEATVKAGRAEFERLVESVRVGK